MQINGQCALLHAEIGRVDPEIVHIQAPTGGQILLQPPPHQTASIRRTLQRAQNKVDQAQTENRGRAASHSQTQETHKKVAVELPIQKQLVFEQSVEKELAAD